MSKNKQIHISNFHISNGKSMLQFNAKIATEKEPNEFVWRILEFECLRVCHELKDEHEHQKQKSGAYNSSETHSVLSQFSTFSLDLLPMNRDVHRFFNSNVSRRVNVEMKCCRLVCAASRRRSHSSSAFFICQS